MMFRTSSRTFLMRINEFSNVRNVCLRASSRRCLSKFDEKKSHKGNAENDGKRFVSNKFSELPEEEVINVKANSKSKDLNLLVNENVLSPKNALNMCNPVEFSKVFYSGDALKVCNSLSVIKAIQLMKWLVNTRTRPVKLIKALADKISQDPGSLNVKNCSDVMYCLSAFSYKDEEVLNKIAAGVVKNKDTLTSTVLPSSLLLSCGILKYRNCELIDVLLKAILSDKNPRRYNEMINAIFTLAVVNYLPPYGVVILNELLKCSVTDFRQTKSYVDFVWATVLLKQFSQEHVSVVLSESFLSQLKVVQGILKNSMAMKLKLININAAANHLLPSYTGPYLSKTECSISPSDSNNSKYLLPLIDGLSHIFPKNGYLLVNVDTGAGFMLDVECYIDSQKNPVPLKKKKDGIKIGIMVLNFNDFCLGKDNVESGLTSFKESILVAKGYKVIKVDNTEYNSKLKLHEKIQYLKQKLENAC